MYRWNLISTIGVRLLNRNGSTFAFNGKRFVQSFSEHNTNSGFNVETYENGEGVRDESINELKLSILEAALPHVHQLSWTRNALAKGAESIGISPASQGLFTRGEVELVEHFYRNCNRKLSSCINVAQSEEKERSELQLKIIREAIEQRLKMILPYIATWSQALTLMAHPPNVPHSLKNLHELVDDILFYAGDRSADFSWYPKRAGIATAYLSTELILIRDKSTNQVETWEFLDRRLKDYVDGGVFYRKAETVVDSLPGFISGSVTTLRNMMNVGSTSR